MCLCSVSTVPSHIQSLINAYNPSDSVQNLSAHLPGARHKAHQFKDWRNNKLLTKRDIVSYEIKKSRYQQLKSVQTGHDKRRKDKTKILRVSLDTFYDDVNIALNSGNDRNNLIPIVSILTGKRYNKNGDYSVDQILPVRINNNWIGIIYRNGSPMSTLIDKYDIINKAILCDPAFDKSKLDFFVNYICKLEIGDNITGSENNNRNISMGYGHGNDEMYGMTPPVYEGNNTTTNDITYNMNNISMDGHMTTTNDMFTYNNISMDGYMNTTTATTTAATNVNGNNNVAGNYKFAPSNGTIINGTLPAINEGYETKQQVLVTAASTPMSPALGTLPSITNSVPMVYGTATNNIINYGNLNVMNSPPLMTNTMGNTITIPVQTSQPIGVAIPNTIVIPNYPKIYKVSPIINLPPNFQMSNYKLVNGIIYEEITVSVQSSMIQSIFKP
eukprot:509831_1